MPYIQLPRLPVLAAFILVFPLFMAAATPPVSAQSYSAMNCSQLWHARNAIYAAKGYCFKTARAQAVFGKRCYAPFGKLSSGEQSQVNAISSVERIRGCK